MDDLIVRSAHVFKEKQGIDVRIEHRVEAVDPVGKVVRGRTSGGEPFEVSYDKLLIATGARPVVPDLPGIVSPGVMTLKNLEDGRKIKQGTRYMRSWTGILMREKGTGRCGERS